MRAGAGPGDEIWGIDSLRPGSSVFSYRIGFECSFVLVRFYFPSVHCNFSRFPCCAVC